ncbi:hypothetical protein BgiBS90_021212 [Biomphalaria glabrata]|nr:hypothetical protein BgiBS90_021212 [Biomphalaria glabrata]
MNMIRIMMGNMSRNIILNKVDESVLQVEGQIDQSVKIVSQAKEEINSLVKGQLPGQDCGCTNSGDGGARYCSAVCDCVVVPLTRTRTMKASRPFLIPCLGCRRVKLRIRAPSMAETETTNLTLAAA